MTPRGALRTRAVVRHTLIGLLLCVTLAAEATVRRSATKPDPKPQDASRAILAAFDTFRVVAIGDRHGTKDLDDFVLSLIRHPSFPNVVNDIVVEGTNSFLQPLLDRYIAGDDVTPADAQRLWRDGTNPSGAGDFQAHLFALVRRINQRLPPAKRLRILAGEPPIDWGIVTQYSPGPRDEHLAAVVQKEVLAKNRTALVFYGLGHVRHGATGMAVARYEAKHPGVTLVIAPYLGVADRLRCDLPTSPEVAAHEAQMSSWPVPSLAQTKDTWLEDLPTATARDSLLAANGMSSGTIDAYLYLGPPALVLAAQPSAYVLLDKDFVGQLQRRGGDARVDPEQVRQRGFRAFACDVP